MSERVAVLIDGHSLRRRVAALAMDIAADHGEAAPVVVGIMNGAVPFMMELLQAMPPTWPDGADYDFLDATSYAGTRPSGRVRITRDLVVDIAGRSVVVVDTVVDTGRTLAAALAHVRARGPRRVRVCALLDKRSRRQVEVPLHYRGFEVEDVFVVGYGMDLDQRYRGLPFVGVLESGS